MGRFTIAIVCALAACGPAVAQTQIQPPITAPPSAPLQILPPTISHDLRIVWEVKNRFRLFRREADFLKHVAAQSIKSVLAAEQIMAAETDGRGWARAMLGNLCIDQMGGVVTTCERDGARENYLAPADHRVEMRIAGASPQATCAWVFDEGEGPPRTFTGPCEEEVRIRLLYGKTTNVTVDVSNPGAPPLRATEQVVVRDLLIAGLGDSIAAGEGNPDRPVTLSDEGFCFRRFGTGSEYYRPGRATYTGDRSCEASTHASSQLPEWTRLGARWMSQACHRSLYGYQIRTALALAIENPHVAVTFLPLACTGATIEAGVLGSQRARELNCAPDKNCPSTVPAQITQLQGYLATARRTRPNRTLDLVLLTVGANDIDFSGLVANVIIDATRERVLFNSMLASPESAESALTRALPGNFAKLRGGVEADGGRRSLACRVRLIRQSRAASGRFRLRRRAERLRRASGVQGGRGSHAPGGRICRRTVPSNPQEHRDLRGQCLRQSSRPHDIRRCASAGVHGARRVRALRAGPRIRPRMLPARGQDVQRQARCRPRPSRSPAARRRRNSAPTRRGPAGSAPPTTPISPR